MSQIRFPASLFRSPAGGLGSHAMTYQHDVFISYKREVNQTAGFATTSRLSYRAILSKISVESPIFFVDERIESEIGADWVKSLATHLATSAIAVIVFSGDYLSSDWCIHELDLMLERAEKYNATKKPSAQLIIPVIGHGRQLLPDPIAHMTPANVEKYRIAWMHKDTPDYHEFSQTNWSFRRKSRRR